MKVERLPGNPLIVPSADPRLGTNINGPSVIQAPGWLRDPLGTYYMYFAHHDGRFIRLAYASRPDGPWNIYSPGTLHIKESGCRDHIASPDVHVDRSGRRVIMYYHGVVDIDPASDPHRNAIDTNPSRIQRTRVAVSGNGLYFTALPGVLAPSYFRVFEWDGDLYGIAMPGIVYRSKDRFGGFRRGPQIFGDDMRHCAVLVRGSTLHVFYSDVGDRPERIKHATVDLSEDWSGWVASEPRTVLAPDEDYEGAHLPLARSERGSANGAVRQLRDPALLEDGDDVFLFYSVAGESGIAGARIIGL